MTIDYQLGDCVQGLARMPAHSVDLTVSSPPYGNLREYGGGRMFTNKEFEAVATELWRLTAPGGVVAWQEGFPINDGAMSLEAYRHVLYFESLGFRLHQQIVTGVVGNSGCSEDRYRRTPQIVFVLSKGKPKNITLLRDRTNVTAGQSRTFKLRKRDGTYDIRTRKYYTEEFGVRTSTWLYACMNHHEAGLIHPALMHGQLAHDLILSFSKRGQHVLDPFAGSCTTGKWCVLTSRSFTGFEIHEPYWKEGMQRLDRARLTRRKQLANSM